MMGMGCRYRICCFLEGMSYVRSRVRTRTHGSVGRRRPLASSDPIV